MVIYDTDKIANTVGVEEAFKRMIEYFFTLSNQAQRVIIPHALAQYLGKKYFNLSDKFDFSEDEVKRFAIEYASYISNNYQKAFILDIEKVSSLAAKYANYYSKLVYHEALPDRLSLKTKIANNVSVSYGYEGLGLDEFVSPDEYQYINSNLLVFLETQEQVASGIKYVKEQLSK